MSMSYLRRNLRLLHRSTRCLRYFGGDLMGAIRAVASLGYREPMDNNVARTLMILPYRHRSAYTTYKHSHKHPYIIKCITER
jgi:hypothetical protein